jgi:colanic acid biosynthesis glycosyl transferase WcaI
MRILFVAHYFQPEQGFFFGLPFASELVRRGHSVEVITGFPNYPGGRIFPDYRGTLFMREQMGNHYPYAALRESRSFGGSPDGQLP